MRKHVKACMCCLLFIFVLTACDEEIRVHHEVDLETYVDLVELPENLVITFDPSKVEVSQTARMYREVTHLAFDVELAKEKLLKSDVVEIKQQAMGPWIRAGDDEAPEVLIVYDAGLGFYGKQMSTFGVLSYVHVPLEYDKPALITTKVGPPDDDEQTFLSISRNRYSSFTDLSFKSYEEAKNDTLNLLSSVGFPELEVVESYSMDLASIQANYEEYLKEIEAMHGADHVKMTEWSVEDEQYVFHFRQIIDEIPITNRTWYWAKGTNTGPVANLVDETTVSASVNQDGVYYIHAVGIFDLSKAIVGEEKKLITPAQALQSLVDEYSLLLLDKGTRITQAELLYVSTPKNDVYELTPAWVFTVAKPSRKLNKITDETIDSYTFYVINAITGEKMSGTR